MPKEECRHMRVRNTRYPTLIMLTCILIAHKADLSYFNTYHAYAQHLQFLNDLHAAHPSNSEIVVAGNSNAGRPITGIHFYGSAGKGLNPAIVLHGTVHAREWISAMVCTPSFNLLYLG